MKRKLLVTLSFLLSMGALSAQNDVANAQHVILGQVPSQDGEIVPMRNTHPDAQWFPEAGLGLFIHFGLAANHGGIDLSWGMFANKRWEDGEIAPVDYWAMADGWNPEKLDFDDIMEKAAKAGFKYAVYTTKHHDGYTFWPSKYSTFGVQTKMGGRDIIKEYVDACRKYNIKVGFYYSPVDWLFDAEYINWDQSGETILDIHHKQIDKLPVKPESHEKARQELVANHVRELLTNYGKIDLIWFDGGKGEISNDEVRKLQPGIVINRRNGPGGDYGDTEGVLPSKRFTGWFETCDPCWPSRWWSYSYSDRMDSANDVLEKLVILRAWGGNLLANVGPYKDGSIPAEALEAWEDLAEWMKHSGESIFGTKPGNFPEESNQPVTLKDDNVYVHVYPNFHKKVKVVTDGIPKKAVLLSTGEEVDFTCKDGAVYLQIKPESRTRFVDTVKLIF